MAIIRPFGDTRHEMLTPKNTLAWQAYKWLRPVQQILSLARPMPFSGDHIWIGSDYSKHPHSSYKTYAYLVCNGVPSEFRDLQSEVRAQHLRNHEMSFKELCKPHCQTALVPMLQAAEAIDGHLIVFVIHEAVQTHAIPASGWQDIRKIFNLKGKWKKGPRAFSDAFRKAHFCAVTLAQWSRPGARLSWITDQDQSIANDDQLYDIWWLTNALTNDHLPHGLSGGPVKMNTTAGDNDKFWFRDFLAIPDLAAGMLSDLSVSYAKDKPWHEAVKEPILASGTLQDKSMVIASWFLSSGPRLRRTCIVMDRTPTGALLVGSWDMDRTRARAASTGIFLPPGAPLQPGVMYVSEPSPT